VAEIVRSGVTAANDQGAADLARAGSVTQLRKGLSFLPHPEPEPDGTDNDAGEEPERRWRVGYGYDDDGTWSLHATGLDPLTGATAETALGAARNSFVP
jgi:hypothetical protein